MTTHTLCFIAILFVSCARGLTDLDIDDNACINNGCDRSWIEDGWCDRNCQNTDCAYDGTDCRSNGTSECVSFNDNNAFCKSIKDIFDLVANALVLDDKISKQEMCAYWATLEALQPQLQDMNVTCTSIFDDGKVDMNLDEFIDVHEFASFSLNFVDDTISPDKAAQIDCSCCEECNGATSSPTLAVESTTTLTTDAEVACNGDALTVANCDETNDEPREQCSIVVDASFAVCSAESFSGQRNNLWGAFKSCLCQTALNSFDDTMRGCFIEKYVSKDTVSMHVNDGLARNMTNCTFSTTFEFATAVFHSDCHYIGDLYSWLVGEASEHSMQVLNSLESCIFQKSKEANNAYPGGFGAISEIQGTIEYRDAKGEVVNNLSQCVAFCDTMLAIFVSVLICLL